MHFLIADTFTDSLTRLTGDEQKAVKTTAFDLQLSPTGKGHSFHRLDKAVDKNFWSVRAGSNLRLIVHKTGGSLLLCYVDHHDKAYDWAKKRKLETHPKTGAAQLVEVRETVKEVVVRKLIEQGQPSQKKAAKLPFAKLTDDELLSCGVPPAWLADVRAADEDSIFQVAEHLPAEATEALLDVAGGGKPKATKLATGGDPFAHPDAKRRFRLVGSAQELEQALDYPWDKWTIFLHPDQRELVEKDYAGPARVTGSAGTGKTIVALHRAAWLARAHPDGRALLTTFSDPLASALKTRLNKLVASEPQLAERIDVCSLDGLALRLYKAQIGSVALAPRQHVLGLIAQASAAVAGHKFTMPFLVSEWDQVADARQAKTWDEYRDAPRLGRRTRLTEPQRKVVWAIFEKVLTSLKAKGQITQAGLFTALADKIKSQSARPYDFAVVDEAQDMGVAQLKFFAALGGGQKNALFFAGDLGQRIFQVPFSWKSMGVDLRGRSRTLKVNYRTSHQIRECADKLLDEEVKDADGEVQDRADTVSVFNGTPPEVRQFKSAAKEVKAVGAWLTSLTKSGLKPDEIGLFVRSDAQLLRAKGAAEAAGVPVKVLDENVATEPGHASVGTMHLAKGLEFRAVAVMACDDQVLPLQSRVEAVGDAADLEEVHETERYLLYVACTRARDTLLVTATDPASEFLDDFGH